MRSFGLLRAVVLSSLVCFLVSCSGGSSNPTTGSQTVNPPGGGTSTGGNPPSGGGTTPPSGGGTTPPSGGGTTPPEGGGTTPPSGGGTTPPSGGGTTPPSGGGTTPPAVKYGVVQGGVVSVSGASVQMYAVGTTGDGSAATPLFATPLVTDADGKFDYAGAYTCPAPDALVYMVATGGDPGTTGGSTNPQISMMTALGPCGDLTPTTNITINEVTTVVAVWALAPYMQSASAIGAGTIDQAALTAAFKTSALLANPATGATPGANAPDDATLPIAEINTLADILSACVDSTGGAAGDGSACGTLFNATAPTNGTAPGDTLSAALLLANNPSQGTATLYSLLPANPPFQPVLTSAPANFTLPTTFPSGLAVTLAPSTFPDTYLEQTATATLTVINNGTSAVHLSQPVLSGPNATEFALNLNDGSSPCSTTTALAASATCTMSVTFAPASTGQKSADLAIVSDAQNPLLHVTLSGKGIQSTPAALNFSYTPDSITFTSFGIPQTLTVTNTGTEPFNLVITPNYQVSDPTMVPDGTAWAKTDNCTQAPIAPSATCTISLTIYSGGDFPQFLTLEAHAGTDVKTEQIALIQTVNFNEDARPINFGSWAVGVPSQPSSRTAVSGTLTGPNASDFSVSCRTTDNLCSFIFTPGGVGVRTATFVTQYGNLALSGTGLAAGPSIAILPATSIPFGVVGKQVGIGVSVVNNGTTNITLATSLVSPSDPGVSIYDTYCPAPLPSGQIPSGQVCQIDLQFSPTKVGSQTVTLQVKDTVSGVTATSSYTVTTPAGLPLSPSTIDLGPAALHQTKTIYSISSSSLNLPFGGQYSFGPATGGNANGDFALSADNCGQYVCITMQFTPSALGLRTTTFLITDTYHPEHLTATLTVQGTGAVPSLELSSNPIIFPDTPVGTTGVQTVTVKNNGPVYTPAYATFIGANKGIYSLGPITCSPTNALDPGSSCIFNVFFTPTSTGPHNGTMQLSDGTTVALQGSGTSSSTQLPLSLSATSLAFPDEPIGFTSAPKAFTITNVGQVTEDVKFQILDEQGQIENDSVFTYSPLSCLGLRPGGSCRIGVNFTANTVGTRTPVLSLKISPTGVSNPPAASIFVQTVALSGTGLAPAGGPLTFRPTGGLFFDQFGATQTATLQNDGDTPVAIQWINYPDNNCGTSLAAHAQCVIQVDGTSGDVTAYAASSSTPYTLPVSTPPGQTLGNPPLIGAGVVPVGSSQYTSLGVTDFHMVQITVLPGPDASSFIGGICSTNGAIHNPCSAGLQFYPQSAGLQTAFIQLVTGDPSTGDPLPPIIYKALGIGASTAPSGAAFTVTQNDFPATIVPGYVGTVTLSNTGTTPLLLYQDNTNITYPYFAVGSPGISSGCSPYSSVLLTPSNEANGVYLPVGQSCTLVLDFIASQGTGSQTQALRFTDAVSGISQSQNLTGNTGPTENAPTISGGDAGTIAVGATTAPVVFTINTPNGEGVILTAAPQQPQPAYITYTLDTGTCAQKTPCTATMTATPTIAGYFYVNLNVNDPSTGLNATGYLSGAAGFPAATFTPASIDFGSQQINVQSVVQQITVKNTGLSALNITGANLTSATPGDFAVNLGTCIQGNLGVNATCTISVAFTPHGDPGTRSGTLQLVDNEQTPSTLQLTGVGTQ